MCDKVAKKPPTTVNLDVVEYDIPESSHYDILPSPAYSTPKPNTYSIPRSSSCGTALLKAYGQSDLKQTAAPDLKETTSGPEPVYAAPDEMSVIANKAYEASGTFTLQAVQPEMNVYSMPDELAKAEETEEFVVVSDKTSQSGLHCCCKCLVVLVVMLLIFLATGVASAALTMVLLHPYARHVCDCAPVQQSGHFADLDALSSVEARLNQTNLELEQSQEQVKMLSAKVAQLSENVTQALDPAPVPTQPPLSILHNCTTVIEHQCTVNPLLGACFTGDVNLTAQNSVVVSVQCLRPLESDEFNPLIATLDVQGDLAKCICYVLDGFESVSRASPVTCGLQVTRCLAANL